MDENTLRALEWASSQNHQSVAARYARILAEYVKSIGNIETNYPDWQGKFPTITAAIACHTKNQDALISRLRANNSTLRTKLKNLVEAIEAGISTDTILECGSQEGSYLGEAKRALEK